MTVSYTHLDVYKRQPLEVAEQRDTKGLYARARRGEIVGFTGIDDPYEAPQNPEITIETLEHTPEENARVVLNMLIEQGFVRTEDARNGNGNGNGLHKN